MPGPTFGAGAPIPGLGGLLTGGLNIPEITPLTPEQIAAIQQYTETGVMPEVATPDPVRSVAPAPSGATINQDAGVTITPTPSPVKSPIRAGTIPPPPSNNVSIMPVPEASSGGGLIAVPGGVEAAPDPGPPRTIMPVGTPTALTDAEGNMVVAQTPEEAAAAAEEEAAAATAAAQAPFLDPTQHSPYSVDVLNEMLSEGSPLLDYAQTQGLQGANRMGLLNSSLAQQASTLGMIQAAQPFALQDAATAGGYLGTTQQGDIAAEAAATLAETDAAAAATAADVAAEAAATLAETDLEMLAAELAADQTINDDQRAFDIINSDMTRDDKLFLMDFFGYDTSGLPTEAEAAAAAEEEAASMYETGDHNAVQETFAASADPFGSMVWNADANPYWETDTVEQNSNGAWVTPDGTNQYSDIGNEMGWYRDWDNPMESHTNDYYGHDGQITTIIATFGSYDNMMRAAEMFYGPLPKDKLETLMTEWVNNNPASP